MFLTEAILLSSAGAVAGLIVGLAADWVVGNIYPALPLRPPPWAIVLAIVTAVASGVIFGLHAGETSCKARSGSVGGRK